MPHYLNGSENTMKVDPNIADLTSLIDWYKRSCDGDWEHTYGVKLETLDNPGWWLTVDLIGTELDGATMNEISEGCDSDAYPDHSQWIHCRVSDNKFSAACDPDQVSRLFREFDQFRNSVTRQ